MDTSKIPMPTDLEISDIRKFISKGHFPKIAAILSGVPDFKFNFWMDESVKSNPHPQLIKLRINLDLGSANLEDCAVDNWVKAFGKDWKASKEYLQIRFPDRWDPDVKKSTSSENEAETAKRSILELIDNPEARAKLEELKELLKGV